MSKVVFEKVKKLLDENKVEYKLLTHEPVYTSEQAAKMRGKGILEGLKRGAKAMIFRCDDKYVQCVVPAHKIVDIKKVKVLLNAKKVKLASPEEVLQVTDCEIGSVPPFGNVFNLLVYCDKDLAEEIDFNAGLHDTSITMKRKDWEKIVKPIIVDISKERAISQETQSSSV